MNEKLKLVKLSTALIKTRFIWMKIMLKFSITKLKLVSVMIKITTTITCRIEDYDIEGELKQTKGDKPKKSFVFNGKENQ